MANALKVQKNVGKGGKIILIIESKNNIGHQSKI